MMISSKASAFFSNGGKSLSPSFLSHFRLFSSSQDRQLFLSSVTEQSELGFSDLKSPLFLYNQMINLRPLPSVVYFNQLFTAIVKLKRLNPHSTIISLFRQLELYGIKPNMHSVGILAYCYCHLGRVDFGFSLLAKRLKLGYPLNSVIFNTLINGYVHCNKLPQAAHLLNKIVKLGFQPDLIMYNTIVKGLCRIGDNASALAFLKKMQSGCHFKPGIVIYNTIIDSLCKDRPLQFRLWGQRVLAEMIESNIAPNLQTYSMLVDMFCKDGCVDQAQSIIKHMIERGVPPDIVTYNALLDGYCLRGQMEDAENLLDLMAENGCEPDRVSFNTMINGYCKSKNVDKALTIFHEMFRKGITPDVVSYTTLIDRLCKANRLPHARKLFEEMLAAGVTPNVVTYASLLDGLCKSALLDEAVKLLEEMEDNGVKPDVVIYNILMDNLCEAGQLEDAAKFFSDLVTKGLQPDIRTYNILIKGFCKKGLMNEAIQLLSKMEENSCLPDSITYNTVIKGFIQHTDFPNALYYRDIMVNKGFEADADTFSLFTDHMFRDDELLQKNIIDNLIVDDITEYERSEETAKIKEMQDLEIEKNENPRCTLAAHMQNIKQELRRQQGRTLQAQPGRSMFLRACTLPVRAGTGQKPWYLKKDPFFLLGSEEQATAAASVRAGVSASTAEESTEPQTPVVEPNVLSAEGELLLKTSVSISLALSTKVFI
uniref:Uncharacterized protein n=1 Tax=Chenopodium quinoa TaxID=63459 RepID=A0A803KNH4_CHEQI